MLIYQTQKAARIRKNPAIAAILRNF